MSSDEEDFFIESSDEEEVEDLPDEVFKKTRLVARFFVAMDDLSEAEILDRKRQWHCPVCQRGPGAVAWYQGIYSLIAHASSTKSRRVNRHRRFSAVLESEINVRKTAGKKQPSDHKVVLPAEDDELFVWPPMIVIRSMKSCQRESRKLMSCFRDYNPAKVLGNAAQGGLSLVVFPDSFVGFCDARRLHNELQDGGAASLFDGHYAVPEDLEGFNRHAKVKTEHLTRSLKEIQEMKMESQGSSSSSLNRTSDEETLEEAFNKKLNVDQTCAVYYFT